MNKLFWSLSIIVLLLSGCGSGTPTRHNDFVPVTSIQIIPISQSIAASKTIAAHTSTKLTVLGNFSGQFSRDITDQAVWSSDTPDVAGFVTATDPSRVTGLKAGTAVLTATVGTVSATFSLTVSSATINAITITPADTSIAKGLTRQLTASGAFSDGTTQDLTFDATWASSDPTVATVSDAADSKGFAKAIAAGTATITATFDSIPGTLQLTVTEPVLQSITVSPADPLLPANPSVLSLSSVSFKATGNFSDGTNPDITSQVTWSSSRTDFATIDAAGAASTKAQGTTTISAGLNGVSGTSSLKVTGGTLSTITLTLKATNMIKDTSLPITATGTFSNGSSRDITGVVTWSVANPAIASVTPQGGNRALLNALAATAAATPTTVTATSGTISSLPTNLTVSASPLSNSLAILPLTLDLTTKTSGRLTLSATLNDGTQQDVTRDATWTSSSNTIATVGTSGIASGKVTGVSSGTVRINASFGNLTAVTAATVTVTPRIFQSLNITTASTALVGSQGSFTATAVYADGTNAIVTEDATWSIDKPNIAILADSTNQPGQVVFVDTGSATISASFDGKTQTATVIVP